MRATRAARAAGATLALLALVIVPPLLLWTFRSAYLPDHLPSWSEITGVLTQADGGEIFLGLLALAGAVAWLQLIAGVAVELAGQIRGHRTPRIRGIRWAQTVAAVLFAVITTTTATAGASPAQAAPIHRVLDTSPPATPAVPTSVRPATTGPETVAETRTPSAQGATAPMTEPDPVATPPYRVQPGDSLMGIAAEQLGDENRWREIYNLNQGKPQADGQALSNPALIRPGWELTLPPPAAATSPASTAGGYEVRGGDTLSAIAAQQLGDETRWGEIYDLNQGKPQPDGRALSDPDLIRPGWQLTLPPPPPGPTTQPAPPPDTQPEPHSPDTPPGPATGEDAAPSSPEQSSPEQTPAQEEQPTAVPTAPTPTDTAEPDIPTDSSASAAAPAAADEDDEGQDPLLLIGGIGGLLAAGALAILGARRMRARRRRRPGHRMPAATPTDLETTLRVKEEPSDVQLLDRSLRTLATQLDREGRDLPALRSVVVTPTHGLILHPAGTDEPAAPFVDTTAASGGGTIWTLDRQAELLDDDAAAAVPAPYPALVTLGMGSTGSVVLANLEQVGAITVTGSRDEIDSVLRGMAADLAASQWADHLVVTLIGCGRTLAAHLPDRLRYADTVDAVLDGFARRAGEVTDRLANAGADSVTAARGRGIAEDVWTPEIILSAEPFTAAQHDRLRTLLRPGGPATGLAAVITGGDPHADPDAVLDGAWRLDASTTGPVLVAELGMRLELQRLTEEQEQQLVIALATAEDTTQVPAEDYQLVPPEPTEIPDPLPAGEADDDGPRSVAELDTVLDSPDLLAPDQPDTEPGPSAEPGAGRSVEDGAEPAYAPDAEPGDRAVGDESGDEVGEESSGAVHTLHADAPEIRLLGKVGLHGVDPALVEAKKLNRLVELAAYLVLNPGVTGEQLALDLGTTDRPWSAATRQGYVSRLRTWLGRDRAGDNYVPPVEVGGGGYRLSDSVRCDWHRFQTLAERGLRAGRDGLPQLQQALNLVTGMPFSNTPAGRYTWNSYLKQEMIDAIVDVAHTVAVRHLEDGELRAARIAVARGLLAEPVSELLYRELILIEYRGNNIAGVRAAAAKIQQIAAALDLELEEETSELIHQTLDPRYRASTTQRAQ